MTTPAEELRAAAAKLRERGRAATPGPWERPLNLRYKNVVTAAKPDDEQGKYLDGRPERVGVVMLNTWSDGSFLRKRGGRDLEWIALASPALAEPLAAWLEDFARWYDQSVEPMLGELHHGDGCEGPVEDCDCFDKALDVARAITGGTP